MSVPRGCILALLLAVAIAHDTTPPPITIVDEARAATPVDPLPLQLRGVVDGKNVSLSLRVFEHDLVGRLTSTFTGVVGNKHIEVDHVQQARWLRGHVDGDAESSVRLTWTEGVIYGTVHSSVFGTLLIDLHHDKDGVPFTVLTHPGAINYVHQELAGHNHGDEPTVVLNETLVQSRARRAGPGSSFHKVCTMFLDADSKWLDYWGGACLSGDTAAQCASRQLGRATVKMIDIIDQMDAVYRASNNFNDKVRFHILGTKVHDSDFGIPATPDGSFVNGGGVLSAYQTFLGQGATFRPNSGYTAADVRGSSYPSSQEVCLNHFFTHTDCGGVLGIATTASTTQNVIGGICATAMLKDSSNNVRAFNTGFTTTKSRSRVAPQWQTVLTTSHEVGHNFGSAHDCCDDGNEQNQCSTETACSTLTGTDPCVPSVAQGGRFLMHPIITNDPDAANAKRLSSCSLSQMQAVIDAKAECFQLPVFCGNGGDCCDGSNLKPSGVSCRSPQGLCDATATCNGDDPFCPMNPTKPDNTPCGTQHGDVCHDGVCSDLHFGYCDGRGLEPCVVPNFECVRSCTLNSQCIVNSKDCNIPGYSFFSNEPSCVRAPTNTPCVTSGNKDGLCLASGKCQECDTPGCGVTNTPDPVVCTWIASDTPCSTTCGSGTLTRSYECVCDDGTKDLSGAKCSTSKPATQTVSCNPGSCPAVDCSCGSWSSYGSCSTTCGSGTKTRSRTCTEAVNGGKTCSQLNLQSQETATCTAGNCPTDCTCGSWSSFSTCSATCGGGSQTRTRTCTEATNGGKTCSQLGLAATQVATCGGTACPVPTDCSCGSWSSYGSCSDPCGGGKKTRTRTCTEGTNGGKTCSQLSLSSQEQASCNTQTCDCTCGSWSSYGPCSQTCGQGIRTRSRTCSEGTHTGKTCAELGLKSQESDTCNQGNCPGPDPCENVECLPASSCEEAGICEAGKCVAQYKPAGSSCTLESSTASAQASAEGICRSRTCNPGLKITVNVASQNFNSVQNDFLEVMRSIVPDFVILDILPGGSRRSRRQLLASTTDVYGGSATKTNTQVADAILTAQKQDPTLGASFTMSVANPNASSGGGGGANGAVIGGVIAALLVVVAIVGFIVYRRKQSGGAAGGSYSKASANAATTRTINNPTFQQNPRANPSDGDIYRAMYTYHAKGKDELSITEGDMIIVTEKSGEWWLGTIGSRTGLFPSNYVRPLEDSAGSQEASFAMNRRLTITLGGMDGATSSDDLTDEPASKPTPNPQPQPRGRLNSMYLPRHKALYAYQGEGISFQQGDVVIITNKDVGAGWWEGRVGSGSTGLIPISYLEPTPLAGVGSAPATRPSRPAVTKPSASSRPPAGGVNLMASAAAAAAASGSGPSRPATKPNVYQPSAGPPARAAVKPPSGASPQPQQRPAVPRGKPQPQNRQPQPRPAQRPVAAAESPKPTPRPKPAGLTAGGPSRPTQPPQHQHQQQRPAMRPPTRPRRDDDVEI